MQIPTVRIPANNARGYKIVNADDPRAKAYADLEWVAMKPLPERQTPQFAGLSRADIDKMKKADLADVLDAHGAEYDARSKVAALRDLAKRVMFVEL